MPVFSASSPVLTDREIIIIKWFNRPFGHAFSSFSAAMAVLLISPLENGSIVVLATAGFIVYIPISIIHYGRTLLERQLRDGYLDKIANSVRFILRVAEVLLNRLGNTKENLQPIVMLLDPEGDWNPKYWNRNLANGKEHVSFRRASMWMAYVDKEDPTTTRFSLDDQLRKQFLTSRDRHCFADINTGIISPIVSGTIMTGQNVIGALIIYSRISSAESILFDLNNDCTKTVKYIAEQLSAIMCYDCHCV